MNRREAIITMTAGLAGLVLTKEASAQKEDKDNREELESVVVAVNAGSIQRDVELLVALNLTRASINLPPFEVGEDGRLRLANNSQL